MSDPEIKPAKWKKERQTLSDSFCDRVKPSAVAQKIWDDRCPGLHLVVTPMGRKSLVFVATAHGRKAWITLGRFATLERPGQTTLNVAKARARAEELRQMANDGKDVRAKVKSARQPREFSALVKRYQEEFLPRLKPSTQTSVKSLLKNHVLPAFEKRLVPEISYEDVDALHAALVRKDVAVTANRVKALLSRLFSLAEKLGWVDRGYNPARLVERIPEVPRDRVLTPAELGKIHCALLTFRVERSMDPAVIGAIRFLAFSGLRRSEVLRLEWADIDGDAQTITIRDHKRSRTMGDLVLPLNSHLASVVAVRKADEERVEYLAKKEGKEYTRPSLIFASARTGEAQGGFSCSWRRLMTKCKVEGATPHDLRRTFATACTEVGNHPATADVLLGHSLGRIRDTYIANGPDGMLRKASQDTADRIVEGMEA